MKHCASEFIGRCNSLKNVIGTDFPIAYPLNLCVCAVPLGKSGKEQEVAQSGQKEEGEKERTVEDEKAHCA